MTRERILALIGFVGLIIAIGTVFFRFIEGWSWLDAYFFTVVTLSTVGYGSLVPATPVGKIATTILIFIGIGAVAVAIQQLGQFAMRSRMETRTQLRQARRKVEEAKKRAEAAEERGPDA